MAFLAVVVSHLNTSLNLRNAQRTISRQQAELKQLREELGVFEVNDRTKAHFIFVRQTEDQAWRWRVYLPAGGNYMMKWATDAIPNEGLSSEWEGQNFQRFPKDDLTFNVDVCLRKGADGKWRWFVRYPWGEFSRELPEEHMLLSPMQPTVTSGDPRRRPGQLTIRDPREPLVLFRYQVKPQADHEAAQAKGQLPVGPYPGIMVWIEPAK